jgi:hypothetical protein
MFVVDISYVISITYGLRAVKLERCRIQRLLLYFNHLGI